jgi:hypothetical protein
LTSKHPWADLENFLDPVLPPVNNELAELSESGVQTMIETTAPDDVLLPINDEFLAASPEGTTAPDILIAGDMTSEYQNADLGSFSYLFPPISDDDFISENKSTELVVDEVKTGSFTERELLEAFLDIEASQIPARQSSESSPSEICPCKARTMIVPERSTPSSS